MDGPDVLLETLRSLGAAFVTTLPDLQKKVRLSRFVNGRGQLLEGGGRSLPDPSDAILTLLFSPNSPPEVDAAVGLILREVLMLKNIHHCINDGGMAYIQADDLDLAAIKHYLLAPLLNRYYSHCSGTAFQPVVWDDLTRPVLAALRDRSVHRTVTTPVLGVRLEEAIQLGSGAIARPATEQERLEWSEDASFERSIARDILVAECVVEVSYPSRWGTARHGQDTGLNVATFDADGTNTAVHTSSFIVAVLRLITGFALPLVFTQERIDAIPWACNRFFHRPMLSDTERRFDKSPLWVRVVDAESLQAADVDKIKLTWDTIAAAATKRPDVLRAVRLLLHERDYVNLYRIFDLIQARVGGQMKKWSSKSDMDRFTQTANSVEAIGDSWARHGRSFSAPRNPMSLASADAPV